MKKYFISGVLAIAISAVFTGCSKSTDLYDEGAQQQAENAKKQAQVTELFATYQTEFVKTFGAIKPGHKWGFENRSTRAAATENYGNYELPNVIGNNVGKNFDKTFNKASGSLQSVPYGEYFVQHVFKQTGFGEGGSGSMSEHQQMAQLQAFNYNTGDWEDVTNFVGGKCVHHMTDDAGTKMTKGVTLMVNMGTPTSNQPQFRWIAKHNATVGGDYVCTNYVIKKINGEYYLGLGYVNKGDTQGNDAKYDAWIIKLVKAEGRPPFAERGRIMCEDLGNIGDFDFNDVVFDATIMNDGSINIEILAAGGTLPITVAGRPVTLGTMMNTGENWTDETQSFTISAAEAAENGWTTLLSIPVKVTGKDGIEYELQARDGQAPGKFCTYIGLPWADEYVNINLAYAGFSTWVANEKPQTWWENKENEIYTDLDLTNN